MQKVGHLFFQDCVAHPTHLGAIARKMQTAEVLNPHVGVAQRLHVIRKRHDPSGAMMGNESLLLIVTVTQYAAGANSRQRLLKR